MSYDDKLTKVSIKHLISHNFYYKIIVTYRDERDEIISVLFFLVKKKNIFFK